MKENLNTNPTENLSPKPAEPHFTPEELAALEKKYAVGSQAYETIPEPQSLGSENQLEVDLGNGQTRVRTDELAQNEDALTVSSLSVAERAQINRDAVVDRIAFSRESIARLEAQIHELDTEIEAMKSSLLKRIINFRSIAQKERFQVSKQQGIEVEQRFMAEDEILKQEYESVLEAELERERVVREEEKNRAEAERQRIVLEQSDREARDITKLVGRYGCYFIHNIVDDTEILRADTRTHKKSFNTALDKRELDWSDRIDIVCGLGPTLSVSTISKPEHETYRQDKSTFTLLLKGGRVLAGSQGDLWTVAEGLKQRTFTEESSKLENIETAITERGDISYNELVLADPEVAGVAFYWPTSEVPEEFTPEYVSSLQGWDTELVDKFNNLWEKIPKLLEKRMDMFILVNNQPRIIYDINVSQRSFKVASVPDKPSNITGRHGVGGYEKIDAMNRVIGKV